jgi:hypothetical protein
MLSVEEETAQLTDSIRMDHCYTSLSPSSASTSATPNHQYVPVGGSDTDASDNSFDQEPGRHPIVSSSTCTQQPARTRGRVSFHYHLKYAVCYLLTTAVLKIKQYC